MISVTSADERDLPFLYITEASVFSDAWSEGAILGHLVSEHTLSLIAREGDTPLGYLLASVLPPEGELYRIAVCPAARRRGVGRLLLDELFRLAIERGAEKIYLEVRESNLSARALYGSVGFETVGLRKNYYRRPDENAAVLVKGLV